MTTKSQKPPILGGKPIGAPPAVPLTAEEEERRALGQKMLDDARTARKTTSDGNDDAPAATSDTPVEPVGDGDLDDGARYVIAWVRENPARTTVLYRTDRAQPALVFLAGVTVTDGVLEIRDLSDPAFECVSVEALAGDSVIAGTSLESVIEDLLEIISSPARLAAIDLELRDELQEDGVDPGDAFRILIERDLGERTAMPTTITAAVTAAQEAAGGLFDNPGGTNHAGDPDAGQPAPTGGLFDVKAYDDPDLAIPKVDGNAIDRIAVAFSGEVFLDRTQKDDVRLYNRLLMGHDVELRVEAKVVGTGAKGATNRDGDLDVIVGKKSLSVKTLYVLTPEEL